MEIWRRLILTAFGCAAIWLYMLASFSPIFTVSVVDFAHEQAWNSRWTLLLCDE